MFKNNMSLLEGNSGRELHTTRQLPLLEENSGRKLHTTKQLPLFKSDGRKQNPPSFTSLDTYLTLKTWILEHLIFGCTYTSGDFLYWFIASVYNSRAFKSDIFRPRWLAHPAKT